MLKTSSFLFRMGKLTNLSGELMEQKGMTFDHDFYVVVDKQCRTEIIVLVTRVRIFCTTLFTNNNIKIVIKSHTFLFHLLKYQYRKPFILQGVAITHRV